MTRGLTVDELLEELELPSHLQNDPVIAQSYAEWQFGIRGIYAGILSWYSGDAVDLHPVPPSLEAAKIVAGFGGLDATLNQVEHELNERCWAWAAKLARYCTRIAPEDERPRQLLATALRAMGHATQAWTTRNVYLTQAGEWERRWTRADLAPRFNATTANQSAPGTFVRALGHRLDPVAAANYDRIYAIIFNDCDHTCGLHIRRGVAEYLPQAPEGDHRLTCTRTDWLRFVFGEIDWPTLITHADVRGENWETLWDLFDDWPPRVRIP